MNVKQKNGKVWLDGLLRHEVRLNQLGNVLACARYLGYEKTEAWLAGATAFAFALNIREDLCPSGPSAWSDHKLLPLASNAGLHIKTYYGSKSQPDYAIKQKEAYGMVRQAIDTGMPVIGAEMKTPEVYLVTGYNDAGHYLFLDYEDGKIRQLHHEKLGFLWFQFPALSPSADDRTTVHQALTTAVQLSEGSSFDSPHCGLRAYDNWIIGLRDVQNRKSGFGAAYNAACWSDARQFTAPFLEEARQRLSNDKLSAHFGEAIKQYSVVAEMLREVARIFPLALGDDSQMVERFMDDSCRRKAADALTEAQSAETAGLTAIRMILDRIQDL